MHVPYRHAAGARLGANLARSQPSVVLLVLSLPFFLSCHLFPRHSFASRAVAMSKPQTSLEAVSNEDRIVALMGPTGVGKSTFIETATRQNGQTVGHGLQSCTSEIRSVRFSHPTDGRPVVFVDTPGFDDTYKSDTEILSMIAEWLTRVYKKEINVTGVLYLHRISDNRVSGSILKNFEVFQEICGADASERIVLVTTMWGEVRQEAGMRREAELKDEYWKEILASGARTERFQDTFKSAWFIVDKVLSRKASAPAGQTSHLPKQKVPTPIPKHVQSGRPVPKRGMTRRYSHQVQSLSLQNEMVDERLWLNETSAGKTLFEALQKLLLDQQEATRRLREQAGKQDNDLLVEKLNERKVEIDQKIVETRNQIKTLKITLLQRVKGFFGARPRI